MRRQPTGNNLTFEESARSDANIVRRLVTAMALIAAVGVVASVARADRGAGVGAATKVFTLTPSGPSDNPESVTFDPRTSAFFVSALGTGTIYRGTVSSDTVTPFLPGGIDGRTMAAGVKVDQDGRLYIAGAATGTIWVYDIATRRLLGRFQTPGSGGFINDLVVMPDGEVFATDSLRPTLWHITAAQVAAGNGTPSGIPVAPEIQYVPGQFNLDGIAASSDGKVLWVVQTATGKLFRIGLDRRQAGGRVIDEVDVTGGPLPSADGLLRESSRQLVIVQNGLGGAPQQIDVLNLSGAGNRADVVHRITDPTFKTPTGITRAGHLWLVTNPDFATSAPPYTVSALARDDG
jgi:Cu-Zn family superoxide dismutase